MPAWMSEEWTAALAASAGSLPPVPSATGSVALTVSAGSRREAHVHWTYMSGKPGEGSPGPLDGADLALTMSSDDAQAVLSGAVEPSVAFMRGRLKASGDGGLLLGFLESTNTPDFASWREEVARMAPETVPR
jgi:hypothetical protein